MGACFKPPPPGHACPNGAVDCDVCGKPFSDVYGFNPTTTGGRQGGCWTGLGIPAGTFSIETQIANGWWCGWGCTGIDGDDAACDDDAFAMAGNPLDGKRWLLPVVDVLGSGRDAYGMLHDLRSNEYHPVQASSKWYRGTCWYNDGRECFGDDVCSCWEQGTRVIAAEDSGCRPGDVPYGGVLQQILPDVLFRVGYHWIDPGAYTVGGNSLGSSAYYCRRFSDSRIGLVDPHEEPGAVTLAAGHHGGMGNIAEGMLEPIGASYSQFQANLLVFCAANLVKPPVNCETSIWYQHIDEFGEGEPQYEFYNTDKESRARFNWLDLDWTMDRPHIDPGPEPTDFQAAVAASKDRVLHDVLGNTYDGITFDRVDHRHAYTQGNGALGYYERTWAGDHIVPGVYGACRLAKAGTPVTCQMHVKGVVLAAYVVLEHLKATQQSASTDRLMEPHMRFQVIVELETVAVPSAPIVLKKWDGTTQTLLLDGLNVVPDVDWIEYVDPEGRAFKPPSVVEWFGFLGEHSRPRARDFRKSVGGNHGTVVANRTADRIRNVPIPGWPMYAESHPESPQGVYAGTVFVSYAA